MSNISHKRNDKNSQHMYKRTIRNNEKLEHWKSRNSSVQISNILNDNYDYDTRAECSCECIELAADEVKKSNGKIKWNCTKTGSSRYHFKCKTTGKPKLKKSQIKRNHLLPSNNCTHCSDKKCVKKFKNECYCCAPPDKPLLPVKPAVTIPNPKRVIPSGFNTSFREPPHNSEILLMAKHLLQDYAPESEFLRKLQKQAKNIYDCQCTACTVKERTANIKYTKNRQLLEDAYENVEKNSLDEQGRQFKSCACQTFTPGNSPRTSQNNINSGSLINSVQNTEIDCDKIHSIKQIREQNYFDTHSTANLSSTNKIPPHKCRHKFTLDNRLLPTPIHTDPFGISLCSFCSKPMERRKEPDAKIESEPKSPRQSAGEDKNFYDFTRRGNYFEGKNSPRKINIAGKNEDIELFVSNELFGDTKDIKLNYRPTNTWALRYQKGMI